jgi:methyl-accepting chemotaxis protein
MVAKNISGVAESASSISSGAQNLRHATGALGTMSSELRELVGQFKYDMATAENGNNKHEN